MQQRESGGVWGGGQGAPDALAKTAHGATASLSPNSCSTGRTAHSVCCCGTHPVTNFTIADRKSLIACPQAPALIPAGRQPPQPCRGAAQPQQLTASLRRQIRADVCPRHGAARTQIHIAPRHRHRHTPLSGGNSTERATALEGAAVQHSILYLYKLDPHDIFHAASGTPVASVNQTGQQVSGVCKLPHRTALPQNTTAVAKTHIPKSNTRVGETAEQLHPHQQVQALLRGTKDRMYPWRFYTEASLTDAVTHSKGGKLTAKPKQQAKCHHRCVIISDNALCRSFTPLDRAIRSQQS